MYGAATNPQLLRAGPPMDSNNPLGMNLGSGVSPVLWPLPGVPTTSAPLNIYNYYWNRLLLMSQPSPMSGMFQSNLQKESLAPTLKRPSSSGYMSSDGESPAKRKHLMFTSS